MATITSVNPATEEVIASYEEHTSAEIEAALDEVHQAFAAWRAVSIAERATPMRRAATHLRRNRDRFAALVTAEMGKPIAEAEAEIEKCAWSCDYFAAHASDYLADQPVATNALESFVAFEPLGTILAIMPWNFPFWQVFRFAAPGLMAGNAAVLKHAPNVIGCALAIEETFQEAGFPRGLLRAVLAPIPAVEGIIADRRIAAVTLTGSDIAGSKVAAIAGRELKKCVLELGGSDPFIVLADADLDGAVEWAIKARFQNGGQSCIAAKRFIVVEEIAEEFERRFADAAGTLTVGDPTARDTKIGPMARRDLRDKLERQVRDSVGAGARVLRGGQARTGRGYFYEPTILADVHPEMTVMREEVFGPVAAVIRVRNVEEALTLANDSRFGLGGNLWTSDVEAGKSLARRIESGGVFINGMTASDPRLPFGGVKRSGYGRELAAFGIHEFVNIQTIWVGPAQGPAQPSTPAE